MPAQMTIHQYDMLVRDMMNEIRTLKAERNALQAHLDDLLDLNIMIAEEK